MKRVKWFFPPSPRGEGMDGLTGVYCIVWSHLECSGGTGNIFYPDRYDCQKKMPDRHTVLKIERTGKLK